MTDRQAKGASLLILNGFWPLDDSQFLRTFINMRQRGTHIMIQLWYDSVLHERFPEDASPQDALIFFNKTKALFPAARLVIRANRS